MNKTEFVKHLRDIATEIKPLTESASSGAAVWNGTEYAKSGKIKKPDPYALSWWSILETIANLIEAQESPLNFKQLEYIEQVLFSGAGSLNDLYFDPKSLGDSAAAINERLNQKRSDLFSSFKG